MAQVQFGIDSGPLNLLSEVAMAVKKRGFDHDGFLSEEEEVKVKRTKLSSSCLDQFVGLKEGYAIPKNWVLDEKSVLEEFFTFCAAKRRSGFTKLRFSCIGIPKNKRTMRRPRTEGILYQDLSLVPLEYYQYPWLLFYCGFEQLSQTQFLTVNGGGVREDADFWSCQFKCPSVTHGPFFDYSDPSSYMPQMDEA